MCFQTRKVLESLIIADTDERWTRSRGIAAERTGDLKPNAGDVRAVDRFERRAIRKMPITADYIDHVPGSLTRQNRKRRNAAAALREATGDYLFPR